MEICDNKRTRTALAPRSGGEFDSEMTTLMLPSSAGKMPTFTSVLFSDMYMLLIEFTRTYDRGWWSAGV